MYGRGFCACARIPFHTHLPSEARRERRSTFSSARMRTEGAKRDEKGEALSRQPVCEQRERSERERRSTFSSAHMRTEDKRSERERRSTFSSACMRTERAKRARKAKRFLVSPYANRESEASEKGEAFSRQPVCEQRERSEARKAKHFLVSPYANRESETRKAKHFLV